MRIPFHGSRPGWLVHCLPGLLASLLLPAGAFAATPSHQTVLCFGDSLTAGFGAQEGLSYPDALREDLRQAGYTVTVLNDGTTNASTSDAVFSLPKIVAQHPSIVVLEFGAVDGLRHQPVEAIAANLEKILKTLEDAHIRVLLARVELPPQLVGADYAARFDALFPVLARRYRVPLIPSLLQGVYGVTPLMSLDHMHPNGLGYQHVAATVLPKLEPMLHR